MAPKRHKTKFIVGDRVVLINLGPYTGIKGEVTRLKGLFSEQYFIETANKRELGPFKSRYLAKDKRNN